MAVSVLSFGRGQEANMPRWMLLLLIVLLAVSVEMSGHRTISLSDPTVHQLCGNAFFRVYRALQRTYSGLYLPLHKSKKSSPLRPRAVQPKVLGVFTTVKICRACFDILTPKNVTVFFSFKTVVGQHYNFHIVKDERNVSKMEGQINFSSRLYVLT